MNDPNHQKQAELDAEVYHAIIEALSENAIFSVTDAKGDIIYANPKFVEISGYSLEELLGQNHRILKSGHQPQEVFIDLWATISSGKIWRGEIKNRAKNGNFYWVDATIVPILGPDGKPKNYAALRTIINEKKKNEEYTQRRAEELEKMNRFMVERELRMMELKQEITDLQEKLSACLNK